MKTFKLNLILVALMLLPMGFLFAQEPGHPQYVRQKGTSEAFPALYQNWQPGQAYSTEMADDEQFFISRVKPKTRFTNAQTQVNPALSPERRFLFWCPIGQNGSSGNQWNAIPTYFYDSEVFNAWSYMDHYGNWTADYIRMPGAFSDVCHKNGVTNSVLASIPFGANITGTDNAGGKNLKALIDGGAEKMLRFLRYYGIDGIGLNSEFNFSTVTLANNFRNLLKNAAAGRNNAQWPTYSTVWYNLMRTDGSLGMGMAGQGGFLSSSNQGWFDSNGEVSNNFFLNYPWYQGDRATATNYLTNSSNLATQLGRSPYDVYAGINMQGASRIWLEEYAASNVSLGIWGAHNMNMLFERRNTNGAAPDIQQDTYMTTSEQFFTGGTRNPVNAPAVSSNFSASPAFCGISKFITARSVLQGNLANEPFVTYFNLGNGKFFNFHGETTFPKEWYNIGMQDYLPTWRWWITNSFMGREAADVPAGLKAGFTWEDAWFGGSSMKVEGSNTGDAYVHLFKTKYPLQNGDKLVIRYKVLAGSGGLAVACSSEGAENTAVSAEIVSKVNSANQLNQWVEKEITVGADGLALDGKTLAMIALKLTDAENLKVLFGELSLTRSQAATPATPVITKSVSLAYRYTGADFKVIFKMNAPDASPETPVYNSDVNTWYFKIYSQQENEDPILCTTTTSWAAYVVGAPVNNDGVKNIRYGVSAVSLDGKTESPIAWSDYTAFPQITIDESIVIDKPVIKANEEFTVKYLDPFHAEATKWEIISQADGQVKKQQDGGTSIVAQLTDLGIYDVRVTYNGVVTVKRGVVQISGAEVGALPIIYTLKANDSQDPIEVQTNDEVTYSYTGRDADGYVSRGLRLPEQPFRIPVNILGLTDKVTSYTLSFWFRSEPIPAGVSTQMLNIRDIKGSWPANNWGYIWNNINPDGTMMLSLRYQTANGGTSMTMSDPTYKFEANVWTHLAYVFNWSGGKLELKLYVNGKLFGQIPATSDVYALQPDKTSIMIGGTAAGRGGLNGVIDEVQFYKKALTPEEVVRSMKHFEANEIPAELTGYFDFETQPNENGQLTSTGTDSSIWAETSEQRPKPGGNEGETEFFPKESVFAPGAPFIAGSVLKIETLPTWKLTGATVLQSAGNTTAGNAKATYAAQGQYKATLTLTNGWGSDAKTFDYVEVKLGSGLSDKRADILSVYPNPFINEVHLRFADAGDYKIDLISITGQSIFSKAVKAQSGEFVNVKVNAPEGHYLIRLSSGGKTIQTVKVIKK